MAEVFSGDLNLKIGDLLSRPLPPRHPRTLLAAVDAYARDTRAHPHVFARVRSRLRARYTRGPVVACARSRSRLSLAPPTPARPFRARTKFRRQSPHLSMPARLRARVCT
jgi:hypothetical protein